MNIRRVSIDLNQFYEEGFAATFLIADHYKAIMSVVNDTEWAKDPDGIYNRIPSWRKNIKYRSTDVEGDRAAQTLKNCPADLKGAVESLIGDNRVIGSLGIFYRLRLDFIDLWDGVESSLGWHWDGPDQSAVFSMIYLNEPNWNDFDGGEIAVGERSLNETPNWLKDYFNVRQIAKIKPAGRNQVWINNSNPRFVHRPLPLSNPDKQRITLMFGCSLIPIL